MLYDIRLSMDYRYPAASDQVRNVLRLLPTNGPRQTIHRRSLTITPAPDLRRDWVDFFGNATTTVAWHRSVAEITYHLAARAQRLSVPHGPAAPFDKIDSLLGTADISALSPWHFRGPSARIGPIAPITDFARAVIGSGQTIDKLIEALGKAVHAHMRFDQTATDVNTPPETAFAAGRGVCQDFAQIMIAGLRGIGIPAGYVSGFLRTSPPPGRPRLEGADAMHGWVMAWAGPGQGWLDYDPTNAQWAGEDYITVAQGRDYADVAPLRGAIRTSGGQETGHRVDVVPLD
jgi:transglutaminase-like putative cysteine protease